MDAYRAADYFHLAYDVDSLDEILSLIDGGDAKAGLIIPPDYSTQEQRPKSKKGIGRCRLRRCPHSRNRPYARGCFPLPCRKLSLTVKRNFNDEVLNLIVEIGDERLNALDYLGCED